jgi:uncharacterized damage-inducible protein DinB
MNIRSLTNQVYSVDPEWISAFAVTEEEARRWAKEELGHSLDELKQVIDDKLADWRRQLNNFKQSSMAPGSAVTLETATAFFDFLKQLPRVVRESISGDETRLESARVTMAELENRFEQAGLDATDRVKSFPDRLAKLQKGVNKDPGL